MTHSRPATRPMPVMMPADAMLSPYMSNAASCDNSRNGLPGSSSARTRSRGRSLPRATWRRARGIAAALLDRRDLRPQVGAKRQHRVAVGRERRVARRELRFDRRHGDPVGCPGVPFAGWAAGMRKGRRQAACGPRVPGHQRVRMHPARLPAQPGEPVADVRMIVPVDADLVGPEQVARKRQVGDGQRGRRRRSARPSRCAFRIAQAASARRRNSAITAGSGSFANVRMKRSVAV